MDEVKALELTVSGLVTLGAAYIGARFAFRFNTQQQANSLRDSRVEECNRAMLNLFRQFNTLASYRKQWLEAHRTSPGRHLNVQANSPQDAAPHAVNVAALAFLLSTDAHAVPGELALLDDGYRNCIQLINTRSAMHREEYQPALEAAVKHYGATTRIHGELVEEWVGPRIVASLRQATDDLYEIVDSTIDAFIKAGVDVTPRLKQVFPGARIISFVPLEGYVAKAAA
ncbi:MAG: hypothetical protein EOP82_26865 [Variovorax sp.]|nr:MAG: hypothetical protein EOP82_26865 [Variovorax sp.]